MKFNPTTRLETIFIPTEGEDSGMGIRGRGGEAGRTSFNDIFIIVSFTVVLGFVLVLFIMTICAFLYLHPLAPAGFLVGMTLVFDWEETTNQATKPGGGAND